MVKEKVADAIETRRALAVERRLSRISKKTSIDAAPANDIANTVDSPTVVMTADQFREHVRLNAKVQAWLAQHRTCSTTLWSSTTRPHPAVAAGDHLGS